MTVGIIGAGLSGLACAYRLKKQGIQSIVFDASELPGGRSRVERKDGFVLDVGAQYLLGPEVFVNTFALIRELGLDDELVAIDPIAGQLYKGRVYHHRVASATGLLHFKGLNVLDKALLPKMALLVSRYGSSVDFQHPALGREHDDESVAAFIRREFSENILNYVAGPLISTLFYYGSHETSKLLYLLLARHMHRTRMYTLRNGIGSLSQHLAERVTVRLNTAIGEIRYDGASFAVGDGRLSKLVIAVRGDQVLRIRGIEDLVSSDDRSFFERCEYQPAVTVFVATDRPVDGACYGLSIPYVEGRTASTVAFHDFMDPAKVPPGAGLLAVTGGGEDVTPERLLEEVREIYRAPELTTARFVQSYEWPSGMPKFPPGRFREIEAFLKRERQAGVFFCGDYLMGPFVESAIGSGFRAAEEVAAGL